jgi:DNA-binding HxlR family transcriptional regulator
VRHTRFDNEVWPIARTTEFIGDWWTPVVMREAFFGCKRFEQFQERVTFSRATLTERLGRLVEEGMLERRAYQTNAVRYEYLLTDRGSSFFDVLAAMWAWGNRLLFDDRGATVELSDRDTSEPIRPGVVDTNRGNPTDVRRIRVRRKR